MSLNCSYKDITWSEYSLSKTESTSCDTDMIVPDAKSDIAKIISAKGDAYVLNSDCTNGRVTINGEVKFNVLYIGDEDSGRINSITKSAPFSLVTSCPDAAENITTIAEVCSSSCSVSLVNSRRLRVSASVVLSIICCKTMQKSALVSAEGAQSISRDVKLTSMQLITKKELSLSESLDLPTGKSPITEILRSSASVTSYETKVLNNKLVIKGNILASILYLSDSAISEAAIEMPFTEVVDAEGVSPLFKTNVKVSSSECDITPDTDLSGEYKMVNISLVLDVIITSSKEEAVTLITDAYLPRGAVKKEIETIVLQSLSDDIREEEFVKDSLPLTKGLPPILRVFDSCCSLSEISFDPESGVASGFAEVTILYISSDPAAPIASFSSKVAFNHKTMVENAENVKADSCHLSYSVVSNDNVDVRLNIRFLVTEADKESISFFTSLEEGKYEPMDRASIIISFATDTDSVWDIAKRHNIPVNDLISANALSPDAPLKKGEKLIIPR